MHLRMYLDSLGIPNVPVTRDFVDLLARAWTTFDGNDDQRMAPWKLERIENPLWEPPVLTFEIERHGAAAMGSTRAEVHQWQVNLDAATARIIGTRWRQIEAAQARLDLEPIAREVARLITDGIEDPSLRWSKDRSSVRLMVSNVLPPACQQTMSGRSKRLKALLTAELAPRGWQPGSQTGRYERVGSSPQD